MAKHGTPLPDFVLDDIVGSPYAVYDYSPDHRVGSPDNLQSLRRSLEKEGLFLILDFVPNHTACDHPWTRRNPERFVQDSGAGSEPCPEGFFRVLDAPGGPCIAHGKDPYFPPWTDTAQINYASPEAVSAMLETLTHISKYCHGLRCDMAMLVLRNIFWKTWVFSPDCYMGDITLYRLLRRWFPFQFPFPVFFLRRS